MTTLQIAFRGIGLACPALLVAWAVTMEEIYLFGGVAAFFVLAGMLLALVLTGYDREKGSPRN